MILKTNDNIESLSLKLQHDFNKAFIVTCVYRHPKYVKKQLNDDYKNLQNIFLTLKRESINMVCLGDFNLRGKFIDPLMKILNVLSLQQIIDVPTRQLNILDLIIVNNDKCVVSKNVYESFLADHLLTECILDIKKPKPAKKVIQFRNLDLINLNELHKELKELTWDFSDSESFLSSFLSKFKSCFDKKAPIKYKTITKRSTKTHFSDATKAILKERDKMNIVLKHKPSNQLKSKMKTLKRRLKLAIRHDTKHKLDNLIQKSNLWSAIKQTHNIKPNSESPNDMDPNIINNHFVNISMPSPHSNTDIPQCPESLTECNNVKFKLNLLTPAQVEKAWKQMKNRDSSSYDHLGICPKMMDMCISSHHFLACITNLFNLFLSTGIIPCMLKKSCIIPLPKTGTPKSPNDLRPIAKLPILIKLFEKCMQLQLTNHIEKNNLLTKFQFGFRKGLSTTHALVALTDFIYNSLDEGKICILVSLDLRKAFDKVVREILIEKLKWYGIDEAVINSHLNERGQYVVCKHNGLTKNSDVKNTLLGVPQGSCVSCFYFNIMINDLPLKIKHCLPILFADDTNLCIASYPSDLPENILKLESDLQGICEWLTENRVELNEDKTKLMVFTGKSYNTDLIEVRLKGKIISHVDSLKILGLNIDNKLTWNSHITQTLKSCYSSLSMIYPLRLLLSEESRTTLVNAYVLSKLNYASVVWSRSLTGVQHNMIDKLLKTSARFILGKRKYDTVTDDIADKLGWMNSHTKARYDVIIFACRLLYNNVLDSYFFNYLTMEAKEARKTRNLTYLSPAISCKNKWGHKSFKFMATKEWLDLPDGIKNSQYLTLKATCNKIKYSLLTEQYTDRALLYLNKMLECD